jgi:hypothetical protein
MDELEKIKLRAYRKYKNYMVAYGKGEINSYTEWSKHVNSIITD